jgi:hypothetical protein
MRTLTIALAALLTAALAVPVSGLAGPDALQRQLLQRLQESKRKQEQAEQAKGMDHHKLMQDHLKMMEENMKIMQEMRPRKGMTMEEHEEWIAEHQKIMDMMLEQMTKDQHMMMQMAK